MSKRTLRLWGIGAALLAALWFGIPRLTAPAVEVVRATHGPAVQAVYATGNVEATVMMPIAPRATARLTQLNADEGEQVTKGQVLAQLEDDDLQNALKEFKVREDFTRNDFHRKAALVKKGIVSATDFDQAKADWEAAKAATARATAEANFMKLVAPDDGLIIKRDGEIGQLIPANQTLFWMSCCAPLRVSAEVDEEDIALVKPDLPVLLRADAFPGKVFHGKVQSVTPKGDAVARSYRVRIEFTEENPLQIGMTAETNIIISEHKDAMLLPGGAVKNNKVWLVKNGTLSQQGVTIGAKGLDQVEILSGITVDDEVVLKPTSGLQAGKRVRSKLVQPPDKK